MPRLVGELLKYRSVSFVGLDKNTGKTETLNYVLCNLPADVCCAVTSLGVDGERSDRLTGTAKPEITLRAGTLFATAEKYFRQRRLTAEVLDVSREGSGLGRVVTARARSEGQVMLSGFASTVALKQWMNALDRFGEHIVLVDGALSRLSLASPAICEAMVLATGAALSADMDTLVRRTAYAVELIRLPWAGAELAANLADAHGGIWIVERDGSLQSLEVRSPLTVSGIDRGLLENARAIYVAGALTERLLAQISLHPRAAEITVAVDDFTRIFISERSYRIFTGKGGRLAVLRKPSLAAITVNPTSPAGFVLDSERLCRKIAEATGVATYDLLAER